MKRQRKCTLRQVWSIELNYCFFFIQKLCKTIFISADNWKVGTSHLFTFTKMGISFLFPIKIVQNGSELTLFKSCLFFQKWKISSRFDPKRLGKTAIIISRNRNVKSSSNIRHFRIRIRKNREFRSDLHPNFG